MAQLAADDFNRADADTLGANWTPVLGTAGIVANECAPKTFDATTNSVQRYSAIGWPNNQYSQVTLRNIHATTGSPGPVVRASAVANTYYLCYCNTTGQLAKLVAGTYTQLGPNIAFAVGDVVKLEAIDTRISVFVNGALASTLLDGSIASGDAGLNCGGDVARRTDNWSAGDTTEIGIFT